LTDEQVAMLGVTSRKRKILLKFLEMYERWKRLLRTPVAEVSRHYCTPPATSFDCERRSAVYEGCVL
jgi:hypothetical protein